MGKENKLTIAGITSKVGHGNPFSLMSIANILEASSVLLNGLGPKIAQIKHKENHQKPLSEKELNEYDKERSGLAGIVFGGLALAEFLIKERLPFYKISDVGIFVQEHLLRMVPESLLRRWFPVGSFLAVPDVESKKSAVEILNEKRILTPVVWNRQAFESLKKQGLHPVLVAPFLPEGIVSEVDFQKELTRKIVVKSSGSGMPKLWVEKLVKYAKTNNIPLEVWLPDKKVIVNKNEKGQWVEQDDESFNPKTLEEYARLFYQSLIDAQPEFLISYPSEMVQVAAWMRDKGWKGNFFMLPGSAVHEEVNAKWAREFLQAETINFDNFDIKNSKRKINEGKTDELRNQLGRLSIKELIFKFVSLGLANDLKLKEAFIFGFGDLEQVFKSDERFFQFLKKYLPFIRSLYQDGEGKDYKRKVNEGLYLRHILRTIVLSDEFYRQLKNKGVELNYEVLMMAAALHDAIEISKKNEGEINEGHIKLKLKAKGFSPDDSEKISQIVEFLVPQGDNPSYFEKKKQDFDRIWDGEGLSGEEKNWWDDNKDYLRAIKAADVLANLEETVDDLKNGREDGRMGRSLVERFQVFEYRVARINQWFEEKLEESLFEQRRRNNQLFLDYLLNRMPRFKKLRTLGLPANTNFKYIIVGDELVIALEQFYNHNRMGPNDCEGGVFVINDKGGVSFIRSASSIEPDRDGRVFFNWLSNGKEGEIKILQPNPNNPFAGLTAEV